MKSTVRAPRGYKWKIKVFPTIFDVASIGLVDSMGHGVGEIRLENLDSSKRILATHSELDYDLHGRGFGTKLYVRAIQWALAHRYKARSSGASSAYAKRVWEGKGIREYFYLRTQ